MLQTEEERVTIELTREQVNKVLGGLKVARGIVKANHQTFQSQPTPYDDTIAAIVDQLREEVYRAAD